MRSFLIKTLMVLFAYNILVCAMSQEEINKLALQVESKMPIANITGELNARRFLKEQGITNPGDINSIIKLAFEIKSNPKLKIALSNLDRPVSKPDTSLGLSAEEINKLALELEPKMKGAGAEILIRRMLAEQGVANNKDQTLVIRKILEIQKNPKLKTGTASGDNSSSKNSLTTLTEKEINSWARKAEPKMNGPMGEFAARNYLKEQGITSKADLNAIIDEIIKIKKQVPSSSDVPSKTTKKSDTTAPIKAIEIPVEVENWAQKLKNFDPETQTFKIIKQLQEGSVDKSLWSQVMSRIKQLRAEKQEDHIITHFEKPAERPVVTPVEEKEMARQDFDSLLKIPSIQKEIGLINDDLSEKMDKAFTKSVGKIHRYGKNFPINKDGTLQLWIAVNIYERVHVIVNNLNSGLLVDGNWYQEYKDMPSLNNLTLSDLQEGISFSLVQSQKFGQSCVNIYVQTSNGKLLASTQLQEINDLRSVNDVKWSGSFLPTIILPHNQSFIVTDNNDLNIETIKIPSDLGYLALRCDIKTILDGYSETISFKMKNSLPILWQDLVVYFNFLGSNLTKTFQEQQAYDWLLRHKENSVYNA